MSGPQQDLRVSLGYSNGQAVRINSTHQVALREAILDVRRELEDIGWTNIATADERASGLEDTAQNRVELLRLARRMRRKNPLAKQAASLLQHYVLGQGITLRANNKPIVAKLVDEFWDNPVNKASFTSHQAMKEVLDTIFTDGEMFLVLFPDREDGMVEIGTLDAMKVEDVITDPENAKIARWYKVKQQRKKYDWTGDRFETDPVSEYVYYRDWRNDDDSAAAGGAPPQAKQRDGLIYHISINKRAKRGESELAAAIDWIRAHRDFMEDRSTINRAAASVAWKKKRKGPASDVAAEMERLRSTLTQSGRGYETNPPPASGSTVIENENSTLEWVKTDTGGSSATADERILRMMSGAGMGGVPNHYFGDEAQANLATATAMELPLLKTYEDWQALLTYVIKDLIEFYLSVCEEARRIGPRDDSRRYAERVTTPQEVVAADADLQEAASDTMTPTLVPNTQPQTFDTASEDVDTEKPVDWYVDVDFPPIIQKDITAFTTALKEFYGILPGQNIESQKLVVEMFLTMLGVNDLDETMERIFPASVIAQITTQPKPEDMARQIAEMVARARLGGGGAPPPRLTTGEERRPDDIVARESLTPMAEYRVRRLLTLARDASETIDAAVGG